MKPAITDADVDDYPGLWLRGAGRGAWQGGVLYELMRWATRTAEPRRRRH